MFQKSEQALEDLRAEIEAAHKMVKDAEKHEPSMDPYLDETKKYHHIPILAPKGAINVLLTLKCYSFISCTIQSMNMSRKQLAVEAAHSTLN
jgi:hypothetical protein